MDNHINPSTTHSILRKWPWYGWLGFALVLVFWVLNWSLPGLRTHWAFFPLWLGYCLVIDALTVMRKGSSMLTRNPKSYMKLFLFSIPAWWFFELINRRTQNWFYTDRQSFTDFQYFALASISFSVVLPAIFGTAELASTWDRLRKVKPGIRITPTRATLFGFFAAGWLMLALLWLWPRYFYPFVWLSIYFILEPINVWSGNRSLAQHTATGDWRPVFALWIGSLACGFFWELWNYYSYPKWIYQVPFVGFLHIFEMPLLGYGGYLPFALEMFSFYHLFAYLLGQSDMQNLVQISPAVETPDPH